MTGSVTGIQGISSFAGSVPEGGLPAVTGAAPARSAGGGGVGAQEPAGDQRHSAPVGCPTAGLPHGLLACESAPPGCEMDFSLRDRSAPTAVHTSGPLQLGGGGGVPGHRSLGRLPGAQPWREPLWLGAACPSAQSQVRCARQASASPVFASNGLASPCPEPQPVEPRPGVL